MRFERFLGGARSGAFISFLIAMIVFNAYGAIVPAIIAAVAAVVFTVITRNAAHPRTTPKASSATLRQAERDGRTGTAELLEIERTSTLYNDIPVYRQVLLVEPKIGRSHTRPSTPSPSDGLSARGSRSCGPPQILRTCCSTRTAPRQAAATAADHMAAADRMAAAVPMAADHMAAAPSAEAALPPAASALPAPSAPRPSGRSSTTMTASTRPSVRSCRSCRTFRSGFGATRCGASPGSSSCSCWRYAPHQQHPHGHRRSAGRPHGTC